MSKNPYQIVWPDALVVRVIQAQRGEVWAICQETGLPRSTAQKWRSRVTRRAIRIADALRREVREAEAQREGDA